MGVEESMPAMGAIVRVAGRELAVARYVRSESLGWTERSAERFSKLRSPGHRRSRGSAQATRSRASPLSRLSPRYPVAWAEDRKSTRLNSSHGYISYAVFCLKKKKA